MIAFRYVFSHLWPRALFIMLTGLMLFIVLDSMESARWLARGSLAQVIRLYLLRAPDILLELMAPGLVLGILSGIGTLNRRAELAALAAGGRSLTRSALPAVMLLAVIMAGGRAVLSETLIPSTSQEALRLSINTFGIYGPRYNAFYLRSEWFRAGPLYGKARPGPDGRYTQVVLVELDDDNSIVRRITAESMEPAGETSFQLRNATITTLAPTTSFERAETRIVELPAAAAALTAPMGYPEHYDLEGLRNAIRRRETGGRDASGYKVALVRRYSDPLMLLLLAVLALPLAARQRRESPVEKLLFVGGVAVALAHVAMMAGDELAARSILPLWVGALAAPLLVAVAAWRAWRGAEGARAAR